MESPKIKILYIDDEKSNLIGFKSSFRELYDVHLAESAQQGREILDTIPIDIIFTDQRMPEVTGVQFLESILEIYPEPMRILITGYTDFSALVDAVNKGNIYRYLQKPWKEEEIIMCVNQAFEVYDLRRKNKKLTEDLAKVNDQLEFLLRQNLLS
ncbi:MAG: response regulator [Bacteroidetes bacterium]|nr:response regulator [Bacteroidota bacterium]